MTIHELLAALQVPGACDFRTDALIGADLAAMSRECQQHAEQLRKEAKANDDDGYPHGGQQMFDAADFLSPSQRMEE
jgi:hypothetical protein